MGYLHNIFSNHPHLSKMITTQAPEKTHNTKQPRFKQNEDGTHSHHILWHPHKRLIGSFNGLFNHHNRRAFLLPLLGEKRGAVIDIKKEREKINKNLARIPSNSNLVKKWGSSHELIGKGSFGVVRLARKHSPDGPDKVYAIKEIKIRSDENTNDYVNRITSEFTISLKLHQRNVIETFDLLPVNETSSVYCQVMEYCNGGDLFNIIYDSSGEGLKAPEANCFFKQLLRGVDYLHSMGIAHRDLKPENLLLTQNGLLKISDFGGSTDFVVKRGDEELVRYCTGLCGSEPYIAPEEFVCYEYDARMVDIWSCAIIYMAMRTGTHLWQDAKEGDPNFDRYIKFRKLIEEERLKMKYEYRRPSFTNLSAQEKSQAQELFELEKNANLIKARDTIRKKAQKDGLDVFQGLEMGAKKLLYRMLDPNPDKRITLDLILENDWFTKICCCQEP